MAHVSTITIFIIIVLFLCFVMLTHLQFIASVFKFQ